MNLWTLPGPARFVLRVERALRDGANVVVRFPVATPSGFGDHVRSRLQESWRCTVFRPEPATPPFGGLRERFAPQLPAEWNPTLLDLCEYEDFRGRLIWLDGVGRMDREDCSAWKKFLVDYAQASRSVPEFERTLFVAVLDGAPPADPPPDDVTLKCFDWRGVIDETDLLLAAHERLHSRDSRAVMRSLLATTVAHVASWDPDVAERLLDEGCDAILNPAPLLQSVAKEKGWTPETDACWEFGTASGNGVPHAALAALEDPPRDLRRRLWSAQASVLLPSIAGWRWDLLLQHRALIAEHLTREGKPEDPLDLDIGDLKGMVQRPGFDPEVQRVVRQMHRWRNELAHLRPLSANAQRLLVLSSESPRKPRRTSPFRA